MCVCVGGGVRAPGGRLSRAARPYVTRGASVCHARAHWLCLAHFAKGFDSRFFYVVWNGQEGNAASLFVIPSKEDLVPFGVPVAIPKAIEKRALALAKEQTARPRFSRMRDCKVCTLVCFRSEQECKTHNHVGANAARS
jgi:hypothetical protein